MSDWTVDTLKQYVDSLRGTDQKAVEAALISVKEENRKTETAAEKRFDLLNELRQGVATKEQLEALEKLLQSLSERITRIESLARGSQLNKTNIYAAVAALGVILGIVVLLANGRL